MHLAPARLALIAALALSACATPQQRCIGAATGELRTLNRLAAETRANIARGFALRTETEVRTVRETCTGQNEDGSTFTFRCDEVETRDRQVPVAIDLNAEQAKLDSLEARIAEREQALGPRVDACREAFPE